MRTRLFMYIGVIGLLAWGAAAPSFAQQQSRGRAEYQQQEQRQDWRQYQQRQNGGADWRRGRDDGDQSGRRWNAGGERGDNQYRSRSSAGRDDGRRWQAGPDRRDAAQNQRWDYGRGQNDRGQKDPSQKDRSQKDRDQYNRDQGKQRKPDASPDRRRAPSSLLPEDEKRRTVIQQFMPHDRARQAVEAGEIRSYGDIRRSVQRQFNGRIVGMELHENRGRGPAYVYDVRVLTQSGDVLSVDMDARTGQVLGVRGGR